MRTARWLAGCMEFVWVHADSFLRRVASPFHSFVTISVYLVPISDEQACLGMRNPVHVNVNVY